MPSEETRLNGGVDANAVANPDAVGHLERNHTSPPLRSALRALVQDFSPTWFTWCMNAGIIAILLHQCPYRFNGIDVIADVFFVIDLALFALFSAILIARLVWFGRRAYDEIADNLGELTMVSCWPISFMTLTSLVSLAASTASWGGHRFSLLAYAMWWFVMAWNTLSFFWFFATWVHRHSNSPSATAVRIPPTIIIPAVSVSTIAVTGAVVATYSSALSARLAVPVILLSFHWVGVGVLLGLILTAYLFHAVLTTGWPAPAQTTSLFILIGPMGQSAAALQILSSAASSHGRFGAYDRGVFLTAASAQALAPACIAAALLLDGLGCIWLLLSLYVVAERAARRQLPWTPGWNAIIFPTGTLTTSFTLLADEMDSAAYRVLTAMLIVAMVAVFLLNLAMTLRRIVSGELLVVRRDPRLVERERAAEDGQKEK